MADWMVPLMPLTRMSLSAGTICGSRAATAGIWIPAPAERIAMATKISQQVGGAGHHEHRERQRDDRDGGVGADDQLLAVQPVRPDAAEDRQDRLRQEPEHRVQGHDPAGLGLQGQVPHHGVLHEHRAEQRDRLPGEEDGDVAAPARSFRRGRRWALPQVGRGAGSVMSLIVSVTSDIEHGRFRDGRRPGHQQVPLPLRRRQGRGALELVGGLVGAARAGPARPPRTAPSRW